MLEINNISKTYRKGSEEFVALGNVNLLIEKGDFVLVNGPSGAGKSTFLNIIGGLIHPDPDSGEILYNGKNIYKQKSSMINEYRKKHVGFMFQQFHLMPYLTVLENIRFGCYDKKHLVAIDRYIEKCSLSGLDNKYPSDLSVGEKQRTAFIRAIISSPDLLLADEPTGNLDPSNSLVLMSLIEDYNNKGGTVVVVSHDPEASKYSNLNISLERGRLMNFQPEQTKF
jgi:ABC-type lipoprotein export system ATPase subunit